MVRRSPYHHHYRDTQDGGRPLYALPADRVQPVLQQRFLTFPA